MPGMFDFLKGIDDYDTRCVGRHDAEWGFVSTAFVHDGRRPYETAVEHRAYRDHGMVIVEAYDSREQAEEGHARWVAAMTAETLPPQLADVANAAICEIGEVFGVDMRDVYPAARSLNVEKGLADDGGDAPPRMQR